MLFAKFSGGYRCLIIESQVTNMQLQHKVFEVLIAKPGQVLCEMGRGDLISVWDSGVLRREVVRLSEKGSKTMVVILI